MVSDSIDLPFFPKYDIEYVFDEKIRVTWFESHFSQSHYNVHNTSKGSNACTLIAVLMASKCNQYKVVINGPQKCLNIRLIQLLASSMLEGNRIHEELKLRNVLKHINLNVPEAIKYAGKQASKMTEWKSEVYMEPLNKSLFDNIRKNWKEWVRPNSETEKLDMYIILVADSRTVLFLIQTKTDTVTLVDSHQHSSEKGAFIAISRRSKLKLLCQWYNEVLSKFYDSEPLLYELSFLYFKQKSELTT
ncbi:uncharacterized protein LOC108911014 [Anoplophora glabripennis]|uniref:uncharacterized protein LOC108911014 n=1 Tax=Anoplophora glabripennis TaxID=217634 RepID=UPI000874B6C5|nr:uncharacterized protein LOC108911014 [Anoplophora glabripennis]